jgi:hypothetical protein
MAQFFGVFSHPFEQGSGTPCGGDAIGAPTSGLPNAAAHLAVLLCFVHRCRAVEWR